MRINRVDTALLKSLAAKAEPDEPKRYTSPWGSNQKFNLDSWLSKYGIIIKRKDEYEGGYRYILECCPFNAVHTGSSAAVFQGSDGILGFKCQHNECADRRWADLRGLFEPGYKDRNDGHQKYLPDSGDVMDTIARTDTGNAEYFNSLYGNILRYDHRRGRWLHWKKHRWVEDVDSGIVRLAIAAARTRYREAINIEDLAERKSASKWAIQCESKTRMDATINIAKSLKPIADSGEDWDHNQMLMGVGNGVLDLQTGKLRDGRQEDRITQYSRVEYNSAAKAPRWSAFLAEVFDNDQELISWLHKCLGYSLTGITTEQCIWICYGAGSNGKSTLLGTIRNIIGTDYAYDAPFTTFELNQRSLIPNDLAALDRRRLITSFEANQGTRLNEARIKALSGDDAVTARYLHCEFFTFRPVGKIWLAVNYRPRVNDDSFGFWRRVRLVPFTRTFQINQKLNCELKAESEGILAWMVEGCLRWVKEGLDPTPECVLAATTEYRSESDPISEFILDKCAINGQATVQSSTLYRAYLAWCDDQGYREKEKMTANAFGRKMGQKFKKIHKEHGTTYMGVGLETDGFLTDFDSKEKNYMLISHAYPRMEVKREMGSDSVIPSVLGQLSYPESPCPVCGGDWALDEHLKYYCPSCDSPKPSTGANK